MKSIVALILLIAAVLLTAGCQTDKAEDPNRVTTLPWNRPESWEGQGPMGAFAPQSH